MKRLFAVLIAALLIQTCWTLAAKAAPQQRPNILFIYSDDHGPWAVGAAGNPQAHTPNLDRLAHDGAYLVNTFTTTPVCSPSRASIMTSRYGTELGITEWIHPRTEPDLGLDPATVIWPEVIKKAGYDTALVGKWHLGVPEQFHPTKMGFDYFMGFLEGGTRLKGATLEVDGKPTKFDELTIDVLTRHAIDYLKRKHEKPFLLCMHHRTPHAPWLPLPEDCWERYADLDPVIPNPDYPKLNIPRVKKVTREYLGSVASLDRAVGQILETLNEQGLADNTLVIYSSDHGYNMGHCGIWHKGNGHWILTDPPPATENIPRGQRPNMYDRSIRMPTIIRWPGVVKPGTVVQQTISNLDWYPTLVAIAGGELPKGETIRGRNFLPILKGKQIPWDNEFYAEYSTHHQSHTHMRMWRTPEWKLVRDFLNPERDELYNLKNDPAETTNLIDADSTEIQRVIAELHAKIVARMRGVNDPALPWVEKHPAEKQK